MQGMLLGKQFTIKVIVYKVMNLLRFTPDNLPGCHAHR